MGYRQQAYFDYVGGLSADGAGNVFLTTDTQVLKIAPNGIIGPVAGTFGIGGSTGDGGPAIAALFNGLDGFHADGQGGFYVSDLITIASGRSRHQGR